MEYFAVGVSAIELSRMFIQVVSLLGSVPAEAKSIARDIQIVSELLDQLHQLQERNMCCPPTIRGITNDIARDCAETCTQLKDITSAMQRRKSTRVLKISKLRTMQAQLEQQKSTLQLTILISNCATMSMSPDNQAKMQQSRTKVESLLDQSETLAQVREIEEEAGEFFDEFDAFSSDDESATSGAGASIMAGHEPPLVDRLFVGQVIRGGYGALTPPPESSVWKTAGRVADASQDRSPGALRRPGAATTHPTQAAVSMRRPKGLGEIYPILFAYWESINRRWESQTLLPAPSSGTIAPRSKTNEDRSGGANVQLATRSSWATAGARGSITASETSLIPQTPTGMVAAERGLLPRPWSSTEKVAAETALIPCGHTGIVAIETTPFSRRSSSTGVSEAETILVPRAQSDITAREISLFPNATGNMASTFISRQSLTFDSNGMDINNQLQTRGPVASHGIPGIQLTPATILDEKQRRVFEFLRWDTQRKKRDKVMVRHYIGSELRSETEELWDYLVFEGPVWTSIPCYAASRAVLRRMKYDFREDGSCFHIFEELSPSDVAEIFSCSLG